MALLHPNSSTTGHGHGYGMVHKLFCLGMTLIEDYSSMNMALDWTQDVCMAGDLQHVCSLKSA